MNQTHEAHEVIKLIDGQIEKVEIFNKAYVQYAATMGDLYDSVSTTSANLNSLQEKVEAHALYFKVCFSLQ